MVSQEEHQTIEWALLSYRVPREPSTPRIAVWRKLKRLGVGQIGDGLVALPDDARTREHLEWVAADVIAADGEAVVWIATTARTASEALARRLRAEREQEYRSLLDEIAGIAGSVDGRTLQRLRRSHRAIERRDYFRAPSRDRSRLAIAALTTAPERAEATS